MNKEKINKIEEEFEKVFGNEIHFDGDVEMNDVKGFFYNKLEEVKREERERIIEIMYKDLHLNTRKLITTDLVEELLNKLK